MQESSPTVSENGTTSARVLASIDSKIHKVPLLLNETCICRVPRLLRKVKEEAYTPQVVSIGPYHHGTERLEAMEDHKLRYVSDFFYRESENSREDFVVSLIGLEKTARDCYEQPFPYESDEFVEMMLIDGCFILELILKCAEYVQEVVAMDPLFRTLSMLSSISSDMLLLENQLPFFILETLFNLFIAPNKNFVGFSFLDLIQHFFSFKIQLNIVQDVPREKINGEKTKHFLDLLRDFCIPSMQTQRVPTESIKVIPSATELHMAGVKFIKATGSGLLAIKFTTNGIFEIPVMAVQESTEILFRNLIAFEQCFQPVSEQYISLYVFLMDLLLNSPDDVATLRSFGIIDNMLDNEQVSHIFNNISKGNTIVSNTPFYYKICKDVNEYYNRPWNSFKAMLFREYFYSPWSSASSIAVITVVICTILQTVSSMMSI
ncbi:hypothetical protein ACHQM5_023057 [Ranunculus cassubicifolius]